ncbi:MAG: hypothetical protein NT088_06400 [Candidatus Omnitrophica bacterium]|nr:hypothetical protein [Candidatus Omnitrophota bacterium]
MKKAGLFKKTVLFSLFGHLTFFSIFNFTFAGSPADFLHTDISFWGGVLSNSQIVRPESGALRNTKQLKVSAKAIPGTAKETNRVFPAALPLFKPQVSVAFNEVKAGFEKEEMPWIKQPKVKEPVIIFHPALPYDFSLYFKDRQIAHVELDFKINPKEEPEAILVKRRVSSGNLEVDLLSLRYIEHYLFIQESRFTPDKWQTVKIDLTGKND